MMESLAHYWPMVLLPALGFAGTYLLLPGSIRRRRPLPGAMLGGLALLLAGWFLIHNEAALPETVLFYIFSALAIVGAALMLSQTNPVRAALSFALVVLSTCGLFLLLAAPFLTAATIIVYAGAIIVTFLFVIMLAQQEGPSSADQRSREPLLASLAGFILMGTLLYVLDRTYSTREADELLAKVQQLAQATSADEIKQVLGDPAGRPIGKKSEPIIADIERTFPRFDRKRLDDINAYLNARPIEAAKLTAAFKEISEYGRQARAFRGVLEPERDLKLSPFSGMPPNMTVSDNKGIRTLPARNVAGLGRTLFSDYLLAVELAGTLLLVASIGAIAIAGRRAEGLR
jgi:NADH:ubiquinone oxidoreductase subunit 6 (subunit J)